MNDTAEFQDLKARWQSGELDERLLLSPRMTEKIPDWAVAWEFYRYLFFTRQLGSFWHEWIMSKGGNLKVPWYSTLGSLLADERFKTHAWFELPRQHRDQFHLQLLNRRAAAEFLQEREDPLKDWCWWTEIALERLRVANQSRNWPERLKARWTAPVLEKPDALEPQVTQMILQVDWSQGIDTIKQAVRDALDALWKKKSSSGRKPRGADNVKKIRELFLLKRVEVMKLQQEEANEVVATVTGEERYLTTKALPAISRALTQARKNLAKFKSVLESVRIPT